MGWWADKKASRRRNKRKPGRRKLGLQRLESRCLLAADIWNQLGGDAGHTSFVDTEVDTGSISEAWYRELNYATYNAGAWRERGVAVDESHVYRTALERSPEETFHVLAYDLESGRIVWHNELTSDAPAGVGEPSVADGVVYVNRAGHSYGAPIDDVVHPDFPRLYGFDSQTGTQVLERAYEAQFGSSERPVIDGSQLFAKDGYYGGISAYETSSLSRQWNVKSPTYQGDSDAALNSDLVFAFGDEVYARSDGVSRGKVDIPGLNVDEENPIVAQTGNPIYSYFGRSSGVTSAGVAMFDGQTLEFLWSFPTEFKPKHKAVGNGIVAVVEGRNLHILNESDGTLRYTWQASNNLSEVVLTRTHAFVLRVDLTTVTAQAVNLTSRKVDWSHVQTEPEGPHLVEFAISQERLFLSAPSGVRVFDYSSEEPWSVDPVDAAFTTGDGRAWLLSQDGKSVREWVPWNRDFARTVTFDARPTAWHFSQDTLWVGLESGSIVKVQDSDGSLKSSQFGTLPHSITALFATEEMVGITHRSGLELDVFDVYGRRLAHRRTGINAQTLVWGDTVNRLFFADQFEIHFFEFEKSDSHFWIAPEPSLLRITQIDEALAWSSDDNLYFVHTGNALDPATGNYVLDLTTPFFGEFEVGDTRIRFHEDEDGNQTIHASQDGETHTFPVYGEEPLLLPLRDDRLLVLTHNLGRLGNLQVLDLPGLRFRSLFPKRNAKNRVDAELGASVVLTPEHLEYEDDFGPREEVRYETFSAPKYGQLRWRDGGDAPVETFTQQQIDAGQLVYESDGSYATYDFFHFHVLDKAGNSTYTVQTAVVPLHNPYPLRSPVESLDVNADNRVSVDDLLVLIGALRRRQAGESIRDGIYPDVLADNEVSISDLAVWVSRVMRRGFGPVDHAAPAPQLAATFDLQRHSSKVLPSTIWADDQQDAWNLHVHIVRLPESGEFRVWRSDEWQTTNTFRLREVAASRVWLRRQGPQVEDDFVELYIEDHLGNATDILRLDLY